MRTQSLKGTFSKLSEDLKQTIKERDSLAQSYASLQKEAEEVRALTRVHLCMCD